MKRFATALIALLALVALVTAAGSLGGADQPTLYSGTTPAEKAPMYNGSGAGDGAPNATQSANVVDDETEAPPPDTGDGGGTSSLIVAGLVGALLVAALLAVILTDDDTRAPPRDEDGGDGGDPSPPTPAVDPAYDSPADNAVVRAWRRLTDRAEGVDDATTPGEAASAAVDRGFPADAVEGITGQFESVRYGHEFPGTEQERRAERLADRLDADRNGRSPGGDGA
ncbi:DUF4129 domain-containing protein [Halosimplex aquaticum]